MHQCKHCHTHTHRHTQTHTQKKTTFSIAIIVMNDKLPQNAFLSKVRNVQMFPMFWFGEIHVDVCERQGVHVCVCVCVWRKCVHVRVWCGVVWCGKAMATLCHFNKSAAIWNGSNGNFTQCEMPTCVIRTVRESGWGSTCWGMVGTLFSV